MRWYLRYGLSYRDVEELLAERGIEVDHVTVYRWVQTFTPEFIDAARPSRHSVGNRWFVDVLLSQHRDGAAARAFFTRALSFGPAPVEITTDRAPVYPRVLEQLTPDARHIVEQYANNVGEADHDRLKARLRPLRGLERIQSASTIAAGHAFVQNLRFGHYELTAELPSHAGSVLRSPSSRPPSDVQCEASPPNPDALIGSTQQSVSRDQTQGGPRG